jgi:hypothetical protein
MRRLQHAAAIALQRCSVETQLVHCRSSFHHKASKNGRHNEPILASVARFRDGSVLAHVVLGNIATELVKGNLAQVALTMHEFENPAVLRLKDFLDCSGYTGL